MFALLSDAIKTTMACMNQKAFLNALDSGEENILAIFLAILEEHRIEYCVIGGLAVNAYVEPLVSLDLDIVVAVLQMDKLLSKISDDYQVEQFSHSINISSKKSDLRIQLQTDPIYQSFIKRSQNQKVLGHTMRVAAVEDVLQGKALAYSDATRRASKRQKDFADILRIIESYPELKDSLADDLQKKIDEGV